MKVASKILLISLIIFFNACKGDNMSNEDIKMVWAPNAVGVKLNTKTNEFVFDGDDESGKYTAEYTKALLEAVNIKQNSPYKKIYQPKYLDPKFHTGQSSTLLEFKEWQALYLKDPVKGMIAPWTKAEKAYYESLDGEERYNYLVTRSGLVCTPVDLNKGALIRPKRPKEKRFVDAYINGMKAFKEAEILDYKGYDTYQKAIKDLSYAYIQGKDYKAGLALAELGYSRNYLRALVGKLEENKNNEELVSKMVSEFVNANDRSIGIYDKLIKDYNLADAYWGLYVYASEIRDRVFDKRFLFVDIEKSKKELYEDALKNGAYGAIRSKTGNLQSNLIAGEYELCLGILGNKKAFVEAAIQIASVDLQSRAFQAIWLGAQLGDEKALEYLYDNPPLNGIHENSLKRKLIQEFAKNPPYDKYGMLPYLDELIPTDWIIDVNEYNFIYSIDGSVTLALLKDIKQGKLKDPRDIDATPESRDEFDQAVVNYRNSYVERYNVDIPNRWSERRVKTYLEELYIHAKLAALTPPQGYPNAPYYFTPERLEAIYKKGDLDSKLDPRIPAMYRANFPEDLRKKIEAYARKHNIKG